MPSQFLLDTNIVSSILKGNTKACHNLARIGFRDDQLKCLLIGYKPEATPEWQQWAFDTCSQHHDKLLAHFNRKAARRQKKSQQKQK